MTPHIPTYFRQHCRGTLPFRTLNIAVALLLGMFAALVAPTSARAHQEPPGCTGSGLGILLFTDAGDTHIGDTIRYSVTVLNGASVGPLVCDATAIKAFVVTPDGVSHPVTLVRTTLRSGESDYYTNVVSYVVRAQDIQSDGTVRATAQDTGEIHQNDTNSQGGANQGVNTEISQPCIRITAACVGAIGESGLITFTGTVLNCGNITLTDLTVTNSVDGGQFRVAVIPSLAPGQSAPISGGWVPVNPCVPSTAALTVQGIDGVLIPRTVTSSTSVTCSETLTPGIDITKFCPVGPVRPGELLMFSGSVSNTGNVTLTNILVVNNRPAPGSPVFTLATLAPGGVATFSGSYLAPTNCTVTDTLSVTAASICGVPVSDSATATCTLLTTPQISIAANCPTSPVLAGGTLNYTGTVRNTGDVTLNNIVVMSDRPGANTVLFNAGSLAPGATASFSASTAVPAGSCTLATALQVSAKDACTSLVASGQVVITCPVVTAPAIAVTLLCPATPASSGGPVLYTGTVRNTGNVMLNQVVVRSPGSVPNTVVLEIPSLAPGASSPFSAAFVAPSDACSLSEVVTVTAADACTAAPVTASATAVCPLVTAPRLVVTQNCPSSPAGLGGVLTYTGTVSNGGNVTLTNVVVTSDRTGSTVVFTVGVLPPGATENFTASYAVPSGSGCSLTSTLTANAFNRCGGARITATAPATCPIQGAPLVAVTLACPSTPTPLGGLLTFTGTVRNAGNITLTNVVVRRSSPGDGTVVFTAATLAPGASANYSGSYSAPTSDVCSVSTSVTASANDNCAGSPVTAVASVECPLGAAPRMVLTQFCPPGSAVPGSAVTYGGSISNAGNVTLTNILVVSTQPAPNTLVFSLPSLAPGESAGFSSVVTAPLDACSVSSALTATGASRCTGGLVNQSVTTTCPLVVSPQITVTKTCPATPVVEGGLLVFSGTVMNTGNVTLTNVMVMNSQPVANTRVLGPISLAPGAITNFTASYAAPLNACSITDTLTATGRDKCLGGSVTNATTTTCPILTVPVLAVTLVCPVSPSATGSPITFSGMVRNAGNVALVNVTVVDAQASPATVLVLPSLAPGASAPFTATFVSPMDACSVVSAVVATASDACSGVGVGATASATCVLATTPKLVVTQECPRDPVSLGGILLYNGSVLNAGDVTLTNVTVTSDRSGSAPVFSIATLAPGAVAGFTASFLVPTNSGCSIAATLTGAGFDPCTGKRVTAAASVNCPLSTQASIRVTQQCPTTTVDPGSILTYRGTVVNTGNVTLTNIVVVSSRPASNTVVYVAATLLPGASATFTGSYTVPADCCVVSSTVRASAQPVCPGPSAADSFTATCTVTGSPRIVVTKVCPISPVKPGDLMEFKGTVKNAGNITLVDVTVVNNLMRGTLLGPIDLAPGETVSYSGAYLMPSDFCGPDTVTARGMSACTLAEVKDAAIVACPVVTTSGILVTKHCPAVPVLKGALFTFTGTVLNSGDVTLNDVYVVNSKPTNGTAVLGPFSLAPGESRDFSGSYVAPSCCCETVDTLTVRARSRCTSEQVTASSTAVCPLEPSPRLTITRNCPAVPVPVGGLMTYTGTFHNAGDVVLTNVMVTSTMPVGGGPILGPIELAPGETKTFAGSYTVVAGSNPANDTVTVRGQELCSGRTVSATADCSGPVPQSVRIEGVRLVNGAVTVTWAGTPGAVYALETRTSTDEAWSVLEGEVTTTGPMGSKTQTIDSIAHRMYRVKVVRE